MKTSFINKLREMLLNVVASPDISMDELPVIKNIYRDKKMFKGNSMTMYTYGDEIVVHNTYYSGSHTQTYSPAKQKTEHDFRTWLPLPKYITHYLQNNNHFPQFYVGEFDDVSVEVSNAGIFISKRYDRDHLQFYNHYEAIKLLKDLHVISKILKHMFKSGSIVYHCENKDERMHITSLVSY